MSGNSSVHNSVVPQSVAQKQSFDLKSWQGLTEVLKKGKDVLSPEAYAEFRNLVLQYAQHGGDVEYKERIDAVIATFSETPQLNKVEGVKLVIDHTQEASPDIEVKTQTPHIPQFMPRRLQPQFATSVTYAVDIPHQHVHKADSTNEKVDHRDEIQQTPPESLHHDAEEPVTQTEHSNASISDRALETVVVQKQEVVEIEKSTEQATQAFDAETKNASSQEESVSISTEDHKKRIAEIKHAVNEQFENPVALMALPDGAGKAYMGALLGALKATGPGAGGSISDAMSRLEKAFETLQSNQIQKKEIVVDKTPHSVKVVAPEPEVIEETPEPTPTPEPVKVVEVATPAPEPVVVVTPEPEVVEIESKPEPVEVAEVETPEPPTEIPEEIHTQKVSSDDTEVVQVEEVSHDLEPREIPLQKSDTEEVLQKIAEEQEKVRLKEDSARASEESSNVDVSPEPPTRSDVMNESFQKTDSAISSVVSSVNKPDEPEQTDVVRTPYTRHPATGDGSQNTNERTDATQREVVDFAPTQFSENKWTKKEISKENPLDVLKDNGFDTSNLRVRQVELFSPKITAMLDKLLHEWNIFAGSGFFGVGPSGAEHPLYLTLAPLSMGEVVAGRWEGADPKIIKIIKQYVDAWRHEQGIAYTTGETFEHYLRRVVQRIVKRQNI